MYGFFKRDFYLILPNLRFYFLFLAVMGIIVTVSQQTVGFFSVYVLAFTVSSLLGLFSYDEFNHWNAYAVAVSRGRKALVDGRYLLSLAAAAVTALLTGVVVALKESGTALATGLLYGGLLLIYLALVLPISYRFGHTKSRLITLSVIVLIFGSVGAGMALTKDKAGLLSNLPFPVPLGLAMLAFGLGALLVSWLISRRVVDRKEF